MNEQEIEKEIQEKGLTAPRVTPEQIENLIASEQYHVFEGSTFTSCLLTLQNGFTVHGESACASTENFDPEIGRKIARDNAKGKIWALEGYLLREKLHRDYLVVPDDVFNEIEKIIKNPPQASQELKNLVKRQRK